MKFLVGLSLFLGLSSAFATPDFRDSNDFALDKYKGQVVYVDFWASWCVPCRVSFPWLIETQERFASDGLRIVTINVDADKEDAESFLRGLPTNFPIVLDPDGEIAEQYDLVGMPSSILIGRDGQVIKRHTGFRNSDKEHLEALIQKALNSRSDS